MGNLSLPLEGLSVYLAVPVNRDFPHQTNMALVNTVCALKDLGVPFVYQQLVGGSIIQTVRSALAHNFLKTDMNRMFWVDSDMAFEAEDFLRILALSGKMPVVGATYPAKKEPNIEFMMNLEGSSVTANEWGCLTIRGMGLGFTCVERKVIEQLAARAVKIRNDQGEMIAQIFRCGVEGDVFVGEDMAFFNDCRALGYDVCCDPNITMDHIGSKAFRGKLMDALVQQ